MYRRMFVFSARAGSGRSGGVGSGQRSFAGLVGSSDQGRKPSVVRGPDVTTSGRGIANRKCPSIQLIPP